MSETPKPPEEFGGWIDFCLADGFPYNGVAHGYARAELAALRAERDRLRKLLVRARVFVRAADREGSDTGLSWHEDAQSELEVTR